MGWFDFLKQRNTAEAVNGTAVTSVTNARLQEATPKETTMPVKGIESIYQFLQADYETRGYNDAFVSPDESYKNDNIKLLIQDFDILLQQVTTYYQDMLRDLDFHIASRSRAGLIDLVEELKVRKEKVHEHMQKVDAMKTEITMQSGMSQRIVLSYQHGFMRGLSALTQSDVLNKQL